MNPEDVKYVLDTLLKTGQLLATEAFQIAYKQAIFYGIWNTAVSVLVFIVAAACAGVANGKLRRIREERSKGGYYDTSEEEVHLLAAFASAVVFTGIALGALFSGLDYLVNTEMGAIRILVNFLK